MTTIGFIGAGKVATESGHDITDPVVRPTAADT
jgi:hypothetical protein